MIIINHQLNNGKGNVLIVLLFRLNQIIIIIRNSEIAVGFNMIVMPYFSIAIGICVISLIVPCLAYLIMSLSIGHLVALLVVVLLHV